MANYIDVSIGIILNQAQQVLIAERSLDVPQGGVWELPGGKVEHGESSYQALVREMQEELGIVIESATYWQSNRYQYPKREVVLHSFRVHHYQGVPYGREGQQIKWVDCNQLSAYQFPHASLPIIAQLSTMMRDAPSTS